MRTFVLSAIAVLAIAAAALVLTTSEAEAYVDCEDCAVAHAQQAAPTADAIAPATADADGNIPWNEPEVKTVEGKCGPGSCRTGSCECHGDCCSVCGTTVMTACCEDGNGNCFPCNPMVCPRCGKGCI